jgi:AraC-like DNA-binding protein
MDKDVKIPESVFRNQMAYRTRGAEAASTSAVPGCGFMLKPDKDGELKDCVMYDYVAVYVLRGEGSYVDWNGKVHALTPGCVAQRIPGRKHSTLLVPDGQWAEVFVLIGRSFFDSLASYGFIDRDRPVLRPGLRPSLVEKFEGVLQDVASGTGPVGPGTLLKAHELISEIYACDRAARAPDPHAELVEEAKIALGDDLMERLPLPELAARFNLSYERFRKVFRERTGFSPGAFRLRKRIEAACRMLAGERMSVKEVAFALGYPDVQSFSKQFAQLAGIAPSSFRSRS